VKEHVEAREQPAFLFLSLLLSFSFFVQIVACLLETWFKAFCSFMDTLESQWLANLSGTGS
jgi:hypothetical protein